MCEERKPAGHRLVAGKLRAFHRRPECFVSSTLPCSEKSFYWRYLIECETAPDASDDKLKQNVCVARPFLPAIIAWSCRSTTLGIYVQITEKTLWSVVSYVFIFYMTLSYQSLRKWQKYDKQQQQKLWDVRLHLISGFLMSSQFPSTDCHAPAMPYVMTVLVG